MVLCTSFLLVIVQFAAEYHNAREGPSPSDLQRPSKHNLGEQVICEHKAGITPSVISNEG